MGLVNVPTIIYSCFVLHNICEMLDGNVDDDAVARQMALNRLQPENDPIAYILLTLQREHM